MSHPPLRFGILGVAKINERWLPGFRRARHADLIGIASRDGKKATRAAEEANIPRAYGSYEELLADPEIQAVYIPLPNVHHDHWTRRAADAGKHVLCEKPLTTTAPQARELIEYCRARKVTLMDGFMWPHHPRTARIRDLLDRGTIGKVHRVDSTFTFQLPLDPGNIRLQAEMGGGSLLDVGCYPVYGIRWAFGEEPVSVFARANYLQAVDLDLTGMMWFADGRVASFDCGFNQPMRQWLEITGTSGVIRVHDMWLPDENAAFEIERNGQPTEVIQVSGHDQIACMVDNFARAAQLGISVRPDPMEAYRSLRVMDALLQSASEQRQIDL
ncbi:MAG: Gfo/Idh/MocA family protein [Gemmataceae bacterium]